MCLAKFSFTVDDEYFVSLSNNHGFDKYRYTDTRRKPQHCKLWKLLRHIEVHSLQLNGTTRLRCTAQLTAEWNKTTVVHSIQLNGTTRLRCTAYN